MNKKLIALFTSAILLGLPVATLADTTAMSTLSQTGCINLTTNLRMGSLSNPSVKLQVLNLQLALANEGLTVDATETGTFGQSTKMAVKAFQEKYKDDVLAPFGYKKGTGNVGVLTRLKLQALYGCRTNTMMQSNVSANLSVTNLILDNNGVTAIFCNKGKNDLTTAPFRIRLNGINRDFEEIGAQKAGACTTDTWGYATWGLSYDPGSTFTAVAIIDPFSVYKSGQLQFPSSVGTTITVPALPGIHLSVRSILLKTNGLQATFCNLGTQVLTSFPVQITVNGTAKTFDVSEVYAPGKCIPKTYTYDNWGITYAPATSYSAIVTVDPKNIYNETNEFDNVASVIGTP